jgi:hypothetical protein
MALFVISYNNSSSFKGAYIDDLGLAHPASLGSEALVLVSIQIIAYFCINPYLLSLVDWHNFMTEEAEALMHCSIRMNTTLKAILTLTILLIISCIAFGCLNTAITTMSDLTYSVAMLFDSAAMTFSFLCFGLYTTLPFEAVQILGSSPFLMMIFFSTTFSPGAGLEGVKFLRYLLARFYFWCMIPGYGASMEECPAENRLVLYTVLSGCLGLALFLIAMGILGQLQKSKDKGGGGSRRGKQQKAQVILRHYRLKCIPPALLLISSPVSNKLLAHRQQPRRECNQATTSYGWIPHNARPVQKTKTGVMRYPAIQILARFKGNNARNAL